ncbi:MAG: diaminopimelate decarboxylase [bacterium]
MHYYYSSARLFCEQVSVLEIADKIETPFYLYSRRTYRENFREIDAAFSSRPHRICYALKANANPQILRDFAELGAGADVVSSGELKFALQAGIPGNDIVFAGVGKRDEEILAALNAGIRGLNVESEAELENINALARMQGIKAPVALRVNPNIDIQGHPYISTGRSADKFGIALDRARTLLKEIHALPNIRLVGLHAHLGSQIISLGPYAEIGKTLAQLVKEAQAANHELSYVDVGGGLGVIYQQTMEIAPETQPHGMWALSPRDVAENLLAPLADISGEIIFEPGRALVATCGILVTRVLYTKVSGGKGFVIVDAGMTDLIRPSLYQAYHQIVPVVYHEGKRQKYDIVGPVCESGDFLGKERELPHMQRGDLLAIMTAGAYGFSLSSNYNARPRPAELIVDGERIVVSRPRQSLASLWEN